MDLDPETIEQLGSQWIAAFEEDEADEEFRERTASRSSVLDAISPYRQRQATATMLLDRFQERLTIIDPMVATIASMRWASFSSHLKVTEIAEATGRAPSTVSDALKAAFARLQIFSRSAEPTSVADSFVPAVATGLPIEEAAFAFWFEYTMSAERAAELTGHGLTGSSRARDRIIAKILALSAGDERLLRWHQALVETVTLPSKIRRSRDAQPHNQAVKAMASTMLGKRRSDLLPRTNAPISWLEGVVGPVDININGDPIVRRANDVEPSAPRSLVLARDFGNPRELLNLTLVVAPRRAILTAFEIVSSGISYTDPFRSEPK